MGACLANYLESAFFREPQIYYGYIESGIGCQEFDCLNSFPSPTYLVTLICEEIFEISADLGVVLNNQHA